MTKTDKYQSIQVLGCFFRVIDLRIDIKHILIENEANFLFLKYTFIISVKEIIFGICPLRYALRNRN